MKPAVELTDVSKMYRKYAYRRQFATLKSAFLKGSLASDLSPEETFLAVNHVSLRVTAGSAFGIVMTGRNVGVLVGPILLPPVAALVAFLATRRAALRVLGDLT